MSKIRLFVEDNLQAGMDMVLKEEQSRYLASVMRLEKGDEVLLFDGKNGEFSAQITDIGKKKVQVVVEKQQKVFEAADDIWLLFAPIKKDCTDFVIEKATELGVSKIVPVITRYTISDKVRVERFRAQAIEASEQCRRVDVPEVFDAQPLKKVLQNWDKKRNLYYMDETGEGDSVSMVFANASTPAAILVGPEGGFCEEELAFLRAQEYAKSVSLGKLILRAETAAVAALSCWQAISGKWR